MNVNEEQLKQYISNFHETLGSTANQFLPPEHRRKLLHNSLLPATIIGYVSTQFGAGVEYHPAEKTEIKIIRGSARIEDLLVRAPPHLRVAQPMFHVREGLSEFHHTGGIYNLTIENAFPFRLAGPNAGFRVGDVVFKNGQWRRAVNYAEIFGNRTKEFWSKESAVARAKDEVLAALANTKRAEDRKLELSEYIEKFKEKTVLLLGDYDAPGLQRLRLLANILTMRGYDPIIIKDLPDIPSQDITQKVSTIGSLARFVMVDDSTKSGHLVEVQLCRTHNWITVLLRKDGVGASWMTAGAAYTSNVILEQAYDEKSPEDAIDAGIKWAEEKVVELAIKFNRLFPWRG